MGKKKNVNVEEATVAVATEPQAAAEVVAEAPANPTPTKKAKKTKASTADGITLADLAERYTAQMEREEKSAGTIASYGMELKTALAALGADTKLADLKPEEVLAYFGSVKVNRKRNGKEKSPLSIAKTQRVLRLALVWAAEAKLIAKAPLPEETATH